MSSYKKGITQILHYKAFPFLRSAHFRYAKCLFPKTKKQSNTLKSSLLIKDTLIQI